MPRHEDDFTVFQRGTTGYFYYRLAGWPRGRRKSTGTSNEKEAYRIALKAFQAGEKPEEPKPTTLGDLLVDAYHWDRCPHVTRLRVEGKVISPTHAKNQRRLLELYVIPDPLAAKPITDIIRDDVLELRDRIRARTTVPQTNKAMKALRTILNEHKWRQHIDRNPTDGVSTLKEDADPVGAFSAKEISALFATCPGVWKDAQAYAAFLLAAATGARKSEVLGVTWAQVDFDRNLLRIDRAFTDNGLPKWDRVRVCFLPTAAANALLQVRAASEHVLPGDLVFSHADASRMGEGWWRFRFQDAMIAAGFIQEVPVLDEHGEETGKTRIENPRRLRPHSLRHALNSALLDLGASGDQVRRALGWSGEAVQRGYTHADVMGFEDLRAKADEIFGASGS